MVVEKLLKHTPHSHMRKDARMNLEESMAKLNKRQREAVNHVDGPRSRTRDQGHKRSRLNKTAL